MPVEEYAWSGHNGNPIYPAAHPLCPGLDMTEKQPNASVTVAVLLAACSRFLRFSQREGVGACCFY